MGDVNERIEKWNGRYARGEGFHGFEPSPPLALAVDGVAPGLALDLASGAGRHTLYLAGRGWRVVAVEGSHEGLSVMAEEVRRRDVGHLVEPHEADLESSPRGFRIEPEAYDLICDFYFLDRTLFPEIRDGVRPGGLFVASIHIEEPSAADHLNPAFLLAPGELEALARSWGWEVLHSHEGSPREGGHNHASAELVARKPVR